MELAERMGFLGHIYEMMNNQLKAPYKLDPTKKYSVEEIYDRQIKSKFGEDKGLEWFKENGCQSSKMTVDEVFPRTWLTVRFPLYFENMLRAGRRVAEVTETMGLKDWDVSDYKALPDWKPCPAYEEKSERDLYAFNFRVPTHTFSFTADNAWLAELAEFNPYAQKVIINTETAKRNGIKDKDRVYVESAVGKVSGIAKVTECVHPETVGISGHFGSLCKSKPVSYGKGANIGNLLPIEIDPVSAGVDSCVRVKVYKA
jgi:anaerobic selenocysteine-containing dehydrogenase